MADLKDTRRGGFYFDGPIPYLSVTNILSIIDKPALRYWFGREVYRAMLKDPTLDEKTALAAPYAVSDVAKNRGRTVDDITQMLEESAVAPEYQLYADAYRQFLKDSPTKLIEQQHSIFDKENKVAGTLDKYWEIGGKLHVTDVKTGKDIYDEVRLQLSAYAHMLRLEGKTVDSISVLLLEVGDDKKPTGKYKFQTLEEDFPAFLAAKTLYEWTNKEKLLKLGYLQP
jgi:hypothetical protein